MQCRGSVENPGGQGGAGTEIGASESARAGGGGGEEVEGEGEGAGKGTDEGVALRSRLMST